MNHLTIKNLIHSAFKKNLSSKTFLGAVMGFIVLVVLILCFIFYYNFASNKEENILPELQAITQAVRTHYQKNIDYRGLNNQIILKENLLPKFMIRNNKIFSLLKKEILIGRDEKGSTLLPFDNFFSVAYVNVDKNMCIRLASQIFDIESGLISIAIKEKDNFYKFTYGDELSLPIKKDIAQKYCSKQNTVIFSFE